VFKHIGVAALAFALAACGGLAARHKTPQTPGATVWPQNLQAPGKIYRVDESRSELRVLVYRAGALARLGHNHVVVNRALGGAVKLTDGASGFALNVPASGFVVDDAQARREEGSDFAAEIPDEAKAGTLRNMLGTAVLDADEFPVITVRSIAVTGTPDAKDSSSMVAKVAISVAGHESTVDMPFRLQSGPNELSATGSLELRQSELGLTPYSLMLGALQVQDAMTLKFTIVAVTA